MNRITMTDLLNVVRLINISTGSPLEPYTTATDKNTGPKNFTVNIGNYRLDGAYGGWKLVRMHNLSGGISEPIVSGYTTKRDLYNLMHAYLRGIESERKK